MPSATTPIPSASSSLAAAPKPAKRKRVRKSRSSKRTTAVLDDDDSGDDDDDSSDDDDDDGDGEARTPATKADEEKTKGGHAAAPVAAESNGEAKDEADQGKRKRKRKRSGKKEAEGGSKEGGGRSEAVKRVEIALGDLTANPGEDESLGEAAKKALEYAYVFTHDRPSWKFRKARQGWLLRHALTPPPSLGAGEAGARSEGEKEEAEDSEGSSSWPDKYVALVGAYFKTIQGASKARLVESLRKAASQETAGEAVVGEASQPAPSTSTSTVSFGELAMRQEAGEGGGTDAAPNPSDAVNSSPEQILWIRNRANGLLVAMGGAE